MVAGAGRELATEMPYFKVAFFELAEMELLINLFSNWVCRELRLPLEYYVIVRKAICIV